MKSNVKIYDLGEETIDRFTIVFLDEPDRSQVNDRYYMSLSLSTKPTGLYGFAQHGEALDGDHLGKIIAFEDLPKEVQDYLRWYGI